MKPSISIFDYIDFREYLRDYYEERHLHERSFSHRYVSKELGDKSPSFFLKVIRERRKLKDVHLAQLPGILLLDDIESSYFKALYYYDISKTKSQREYWLAQIVAECTATRKTTDLIADQYYEKWYHSAIRCVLSAIDTDGDVSPICTALHAKLSRSEVRESLALLKRLGLIDFNDRGFLKPIDSALFCKKDIHSGILQSFRLNSLELCKEATLKSDLNWPTEMHTSTFSISRNAWNRILHRLQEFRSDVRNIVRTDSDKADRVVHINHTAFPLTSALDDDNKS